MSRRTRYQNGSVQREKRRSSPYVWVFRWWEPGSEGTNKRRKAIVGNILALPTEAIALKAARALRIDANTQTPQAESGPETIADLVAHYRLKELNEGSNSHKSFPTRAAYQSYLDNWVLPRWGGLRLDQIKTRRSRRMARWDQAGESNTSQDSEPVECSFQSRDAVRVDGQKSDQARAPERKAGTHP
jgi:hypothetical protein